MTSLADLQAKAGVRLHRQLLLERVINRGILPSHYPNPSYKDFISAYIGDYLKEEIAAEGLVRNLPAFANFLHAASFSDGETLVYKNIALDWGVFTKHGEILL